MPSEHKYIHLYREYPVGKIETLNASVTNKIYSK